MHEHRSLLGWGSWVVGGGLPVQSDRAEAGPLGDPPAFGRLGLLMATRPLDILLDPHKLVMGLSAVTDEADWLLVDGQLASDLAEKDRLFREERDQVLVETQASRPAQQEILEVVVDHLAAHHRVTHRVEGSSVEIPEAEVRVRLDAEQPPLEIASRLVQEDLVAMERRPEGWCLTAGAVCFPTRWDLPSKLGQPLAGLHEPVPGYEGPLADSTERFFERVQPGLAYQRGNWSLVDDPKLFQPGGTDRGAADPTITASNAGDTTWLRREHQTLRALPRTGVVLFTIRIFQDPLRTVGRDPELARRLLGAVRTMDPALQHYKSMPVLRDAVVAYLEDRLQEVSS